MICNNCGHERESHEDEYDENAKLISEFTGKCQMKEDGCKCKKFVKRRVGEVRIKEIKDALGGKDE